MSYKLFKQLTICTGTTLHGGFPKFFHKSLHFFTIQLWIGLGNRWKMERFIEELGKTSM